MSKRITITIYDDNTSFSSALYYAMKTELCRDESKTEQMLTTFVNGKMCVIEKTKTNNLTIKLCEKNT